MIEHLEMLLDNFPGATNQTCCFLHVLNLMVKSILKQFDLLKSKKSKKKLATMMERTKKMMDLMIMIMGLVATDDDENNQGTEELLKLAGNFDIEGELMADIEEEDSVEGWIDEHDKMTENELKNLLASIMPVRLLLTKIRILQINYYLFF